MAEISMKLLFKKGVELLRDNKLKESLELFEYGLNESKKDKDKGPLLYNIAVCQLRLGNKELGMEAIKKGIVFQPWLLGKAQKDKDLKVLYGTKEFEDLIKNNKWRFVRTRNWYTTWALIFYIVGFSRIYFRYITFKIVGQLSLVGLAFSKAIEYTAMSLFFAWIIGNIVEGIVAFKHGVRETE
jgi:hypothetical protein